MASRRKPAIAGVVTGAVLGVLWFSLPAIVKWRIHADHPDVTVGSVRVGWKVFYLKGIKIDRKWLRGTLDDATVSWSGDDVSIEGGHLDVDLDAKPKGASSDASGRHITFMDLTAHITKGQAVIDLEGLDTAAPPSTDICWAKGTVKHPRAEAVFDEGCAMRDGSRASVSDATLKAIDIPHVPAGSTVDLGMVDYDGQKATISVATGTMELAADKTAKFEATDLTVSPDDVEVKQVKVNHPWISSDPVTFNKVTAVHDGKWWHVAINGATFDVNPEGLAAHSRAAYGAPADQTCQAWVDALPDELRIEPLRSLKFEGNFSWSVDLKAVGKDGKPKPLIDFGYCKVPKSSCDPIRAVRKRFTYWVYSPVGDLIERSTGPGTDGWTPLAATGPMETAVINSEDYGFRSHRGFILAAYYAALEADLKAGTFVRGGSTVTMQLAKNLWLQRSKTLGRKIQELFLTMALESCLSKDEIMEEYLNVVEFGPMVYGIKEGAHFWFHKEPEDLQSVEAFWLASILTNPHSGRHPSPEALAETSKLMAKLASMGRNIPDLPLQDLGDQPPK